MAKGFAGTVFLTTDDCQASYEELKSRGVEFTDEPEERPYGIDSGFRDPSGNSLRLTRGARPQSSLSSRSAAHRGSGSRSCAWSGPRGVEVLAADRAQPEALGAADDLRRQGQGERVARPALTSS